MTVHSEGGGRELGMRPTGWGLGEGGLLAECQYWRFWWRSGAGGLTWCKDATNQLRTCGEIVAILQTWLVPMRAHEMASVTLSNTAVDTLGEPEAL